MARRSTDSAMFKQSGVKKPLHHALSSFSLLEGLSRTKSSIMTRRRLAKPHSLPLDSQSLEKTCKKAGKKILRKQRTLGDILENDSGLGYRKCSRVAHLGNDWDQRLTRQPSFTGSYPDISHLCVSEDEIRVKCDSPMDVDKTPEEYNRRIEDLFLVQQAPLWGMQLRSGNVVQKGKLHAQGSSKSVLCSSADHRPPVQRRKSAFRANRPDQICSQILDFLYLGSIESAYNEPLLCKLNIQVLVDLSNVSAGRVPSEKKTNCPCACQKATHFRSRLNVGVDDIEWENIGQHFNDINRFIEGAKKHNKNVLVFSYHGKSRAAAAVIQYVMRHFQISLYNACAFVEERRDIAVNSGFLKALQRVEDELRRESSSLAQHTNKEMVMKVASSKTRTAWSEVESSI